MSCWQAIDIKLKCRRLLQRPANAFTWERPGVADLNAGPWPLAVTVGVATIVQGLVMPHYADERLPLPSALEQLGGLIAAWSGGPAETSSAMAERATTIAAAPTTAPVATPTASSRECMICEDAPRETRFACGHSVCCRGCVSRLEQAAMQAAARQLGQETAGVGEEEPGVVCPVCKQPIGDVVANASVASQPTYVQPRRGTAATSGGTPRVPVPIEDESGLHPIAGRGGRSGGGRRGGGGGRGGWRRSGGGRAARQASPQARH